jgi:hypothetical protein
MDFCIHLLSFLKKSSREYTLSDFKNSKKRCIQVETIENSKYTREYNYCKIPKPSSKTSLSRKTFPKIAKKKIR